MSRTIVVGLSALFIAASPVAHAQPQPTAGSPPATETAQAPERLSDADFKAITDRRIELLKFALQLTPDQAKNWPAVEEAIRARATARHQRLVNLAARLGAQRDITPVDLLRERAEVLATRAANLKKLADAWQPLYASLDANQKDRLRLLAAYVFYEMRNAAESRRLQAEDEYYDEAQE
jgi:LTXXQ motif family protein